MSFWNRLFGKKDTDSAPSSDAQKVKKRLESHPDYEHLKGMVNNFGGSGLSGDEVVNIIADVVSKNKKPK